MFDPQAGTLRVPESIALVEMSSMAFAVTTPDKSGGFLALVQTYSGNEKAKINRKHKRRARMCRCRS